MQEDSNRAKIWRRTLLHKSAFKVTEKEKPSWTLSNTCSSLKMDGSSDHFLQSFIKCELKTTVIADRLDHNWYWPVQLFLSTVWSHKIFQSGTKLLWKSTSKWDYIKKTAKRLSFLRYRKLINKGQSDHYFFPFKNTSKEARWIQNVH